MLSSLLFLEKGGLQNAVRSISVRNHCIDMRNMEHLDTSSWSEECLEAKTNLSVVRVGNLHDWGPAQDYALDVLVPRFIHEKIPGFKRDAKKDYPATFSAFVSPRRLAEIAPAPFEMQDYLTTLIEVMPGFVSAVLNNKILDVWHVPRPAQSVSVCALLTCCYFFPYRALTLSLFVATGRDSTRRTRD